MFKLLSVRRFLPALVRTLHASFCACTRTHVPTHTCTFYFMTDPYLTPKGPPTDPRLRPYGALIDLQRTPVTLNSLFQWPLQLR